MEKYDEDEGKKRPRVEAYSLGSGAEFDFFPDLDPSGMAAGSAEQAAVVDLKNGTYHPFMQALKYTGEWAGKPHVSTFSASLTEKMDGAIVPLRGADRFTYDPKSAAADRTGISVGMPMPRGDSQGGITAEAQRIEELEKTYGAPAHRIPLRRKYYANPRQYYDHVLLACLLYTSPSPRD